MATTLSDIASALGVSKMTVSRAIRNHPTINAETRERVLKVARQMKYQPNHFARALTTNRSYLIGVVVPDLVPSYFAELTRGIETVARPAGFQILICNTDEDSGKEVEEVEALRHRTDGLVIASALPPEETKVYRKMLAEGTRIVLFDRPLESLRCSVVTTDNVKVGRLATEHLIDLGHLQIGHLYGNLSAVATDRCEGYKQALSARGVRFKKSLVRDCGFLERDGYEAMSAWIKAGGVPSAIFVANDGAAIGVMQAIEDAGLRVPEDVALVGAGNIHYGDLLRVPLTTVDWGKIEMGRQAARLLIDSIAGEGAKSKSAERIIIAPELVVRRSCGASKTVERVR